MRQCRRSSISNIGTTAVVNILPPLSQLVCPDVQRNFYGESSLLTREVDKNFSRGIGGALELGGGVQRSPEANFFPPIKPHGEEEEEDSSAKSPINSKKQASSTKKSSFVQQQQHQKAVFTHGEWGILKESWTLSLLNLKGNRRPRRRRGNSTDGPAATFFFFFKHFHYIFKVGTLGLPPLRRNEQVDGWPKSSSSSQFVLRQPNPSVSLKMHT